jgi:uncharacterized membrane protein
MVHDRDRRVMLVGWHRCVGTTYSSRPVGLPWLAVVLMALAIVGLHLNGQLRQFQLDCSPGLQKLKELDSRHPHAMPVYADWESG